MNSITMDIGARLTQCLLAIGVCFSAWGLSAELPAQDDSFLQNQLGVGGLPAEETLTLEGEYKLKTGTRRGLLEVRASVAIGWHIFSITQKKGGPVASTLAIGESDKFKLLGQFQADPKPHVTDDDVFNMQVEEHEGLVVWTVPIELLADVDPKDLSIDLIYNGQACESKPNGSCKPIFDVPVSAKFGGYDENLDLSVAPQELELVPFRPEKLHATVVGQVFKAAPDGKPIQPGDVLQLDITAQAVDKFHVYAYSTLKEKEKRPYVPTLVSWVDTNRWSVKGPKVSQPPSRDDESFGPNEPVFYHEDKVTWSFTIKVPDDAIAGQLVALTGGMQLQTCLKTECDRPVDLGFSVAIPVGTATAAALKFEPATFGSVKKAVESGKFATPLNAAETGGNSSTPDTNDSGGGVPTASEAAPGTVADSPELIAEMAKLYDPSEPIKYLNFSEMDANPIGSGGTSSASQTTFLTALFGAFVGGMLLNLMPCVFPVLGLKVMGFVKQGGEDPAKIRMHGIAFAMGLLVSMWILAGTILVVKFGFGESIQWGAQMANPYFVGFIIVLLFVLGLNMAGVFEFGTSLTSVGGSVSGKSGYSSSFFSGVLTTLIATPCSGPFLGTAMSYTLSQPPLFSMFMFTVFGLGIAFPYILLAFFPPLIQRLPKPGPWMDTFKVSMAFALFATVAFFMRTFGVQTGIDGLSLLLMALVIIGLATFFYGTWGEPHVKAGRRWVLGYIAPTMIAGAGVWMAWDAANHAAAPVEGASQTGELSWAQWKPGKVKHSLARHRRILWVDYTASW